MDLTCAACGRILIQRFDFQTTFVITAGVKLLAWLPLVPVPWILGDDLCRCSRSRTAASLEEAQEPLLPAGQQEQHYESTVAAEAEPGLLAAATTVPDAVGADLQQAQTKR